MYLIRARPAAAEPESHTRPPCSWACVRLPCALRPIKRCLPCHRKSVLPDPGGVGERYFDADLNRCYLT